MNRGRNNGRGRGGPRNVNGSLQMLKSSLHGHENRLTATNPPPFNRKPFNTIVVESEVSVPPTPPNSPIPRERLLNPYANVGVTASVDTGTITIGAIIKALQEQLETSVVTGLVIKIKRIDLWSLGGLETVPTIRGKFYSLNTQISGQTVPQVRVNPLKVLEDIGCPGASAAVVSYTFPRDQADYSLSAGDHHDPVVVDWKTQSVNLKCFARYHLFWNTADKFIQTPT